MTASIVATTRKANCSIRMVKFTFIDIHGQKSFFRICAFIWKYLRIKPPTSTWVSINEMLDTYSAVTLEANLTNPFPNATIEHTKRLRHSRSFTAAMLRTLERAHSVSLLSGPLTCKCPPAIRHQQRAARERQEKKTLNWNVNSNFWHAGDIWESRAASQEKCKK